MLQWLATEHEDPDREFWQEDASGGQPYYGGDIHGNGINTTRGRASRAVQKLILADATYIHMDITDYNAIVYATFSIRRRACAKS